MNVKDKLTSRKFWLSAAAFLGSIATTIAGFASNNDTITIIGVICGTVSAAIYAACEACIDKNAIVITTEIEEVEDDE